MRKATGLLVLLALAIGAGPPSARAAEAPADDIAKWEYRVLTKDQVIELGKKDLAAGLNLLGEEGWELAAVESAFIFKRPKQTKSLEELKRRLAAAEAAAAMQAERAAWSESMVKKGFLGQAQLHAERQLLKERELALEKAKKDLQPHPASQKKDQPPAK